MSTLTGEELAPRAPANNGQGLARALGWFSVGLGAQELLMPRLLMRLIGAPDPKRRRGRNRLLFALLGVRELAAGVGLLTMRERPRPWAWARVAGDAIDLALLGALAGRRGTDKQRVGWAIGAVAGVTALDVLAGLGVGGHQLGRALSSPQTARKAITIRRSPDEVYRFWRELDNLPLFMAHLDSIEPIADGRTRWTVRGPAGRTVSWEAEVVEDRPGERIAWRSMPDSAIANAGVVRFAAAPGGRGTEVHVELTYGAPGGKLGALVASLFGEEPTQQLDGDLRRLKQVLETGEVMQSDASLSGRAHPAQPRRGEVKPLGVAVQTAPALEPLPTQRVNDAVDKAGERGARTNSEEDRL